MPHPSDTPKPADVPPSEYPTFKPEFRRELAAVLNRHGIDNWAEMPDHILAAALADMIGAVRAARIDTARWMGQPLLGEKLSASIADGERGGQA